MPCGRSVVLAVSLASAAGAIGLAPETAAAWNSYVASARAQVEAQQSDPGVFIRADEVSGLRRSLLRGEAVVWASAKKNPLHVPGALIHRWTGSVFIPGACLADVLSTVRDYNRFGAFYSSAIESRLIERNGNVDRFNAIEKHKALASTIGLDADFRVEYAHIDNTRAFSVSDSTRIQQIQDYGGSGERELPAGAADAYLWALSTVTRYEEGDRGVFVEVQASALSRKIPGWLHWLVGPFVRRAAIESMTARLVQTRKAVLANLPDLGTRR